MLLALFSAMLFSVCSTDFEAVGVANHSETAASLAVGRRGEEMCLGVLQVTVALTHWIYHLTGANEKVSCSQSLPSVFVISVKFLKKQL